MVLFVVSWVAIAHFPSEKIQDYASQKITPKNEYLSKREAIDSLKLAGHLPRTNCNRHHLSGHTGKLAPTTVTASYGNVIHFSTRWDNPALPLRSYFLPQSHGGGLHWTWWNDSLATTIAWFNTLGIFCVRIC